MAARTLSSLVASVRHVAHAQLGLQCLALLVGHVGDDDLGARAVQPPDGGLAEAAGTADDDRGAPTDLHTVSLLATAHSQTERILFSLADRRQPEVIGAMMTDDIAELVAAARGRVRRGRPAGC